jgi:hypothetical protein
MIEISHSCLGLWRTLQRSPTVSLGSGVVSRHFLLNGTKASCAHVDVDRTICRHDSCLMHVRHPAAIRSTLGMAYIVAELSGLTADITLPWQIYKTPFTKADFCGIIEKDYQDLDNGGLWPIGSGESVARPVIWLSVCGGE